MLKTLKIADIKIGKRHRKDMGDLTSLAENRALTVRFMRHNR